MFFNIISVRLYKAFIKILYGRGILLAIADDVKICSPFSILAEIVGKLPALAMSEAGLTTQASKNIFYVRPSARATWMAYLDSNPRFVDTNVLSLYDIPDGRLPKLDESEDSHHDSYHGPYWPENDGINILGTPLGSPEFVKEYLQGKLDKHNVLLDIIVDVAKMGFSREAHKMPTGAAIPCLSHFLKSVPIDPSTSEWM